MVNDNNIKGNIKGNIKLIEGYKMALSSMPDSLDDAKESVKRQYEKLEYYPNIHTFDEPYDDNALFYEALHRLNRSTDIDSCKKAYVLLKDYLVDKPGCIMGETMLKVIAKQLED